jgi:phage-related tail fiber protein
MPRKVMNGLDLTGQKISNLADGTAAADAVTKAQLDGVARGLQWKSSVKAATTTNITLSGTQTIDGVSLGIGDRVLVKDQSSANANGIYVVASGAWSRATDFDDTTEVKTASAITVEQGTVNGDKSFILTTDGAITVGTTALNFSPLGGTGTAYTAGDGLDLTGNAFSLDIKAGSGLTITSTELDLDIAVIKSLLGISGKYAVNVPTSTTATITHNLGTTDVVVAVYEISGGAEVDVDVAVTSVNVVTLTFATAPTAGQFRCVVMG